MGKVLKVMIHRWESADLGVSKSEDAGSIATHELTILNIQVPSQDKSRVTEKLLAVGIQNEKNKNIRSWEVVSPNKSGGKKSTQKMYGYNEDTYIKSFCENRRGNPWTVKQETMFWPSQMFNIFVFKETQVETTVR